MSFILRFLRWLVGAPIRVVKQARREPDIYDKAAEELVPAKGTGFSYNGAGVRSRLGLPWQANDRDAIHYFIHWGDLAYDWPAYYCSIALTNTSYSSIKSWYILDTRFRTRRGAVKTLAKSLRLLSEEYRPKDPLEVLAEAEL